MFPHAVVIPVLNNESTISAVIAEMVSHFENVIVVEDGSSDRSREIILQHHNITTICFDANRGKGAAIRAGFEKAAHLGCSYAITIDGSGQYGIEQCKRLIEISEQSPESIVIGRRTTIPPLSRFSNIWVKLFTGVELKDSHSGCRLYPLFLMDSLSFKRNRYDFELEVLFESALSGITIEETAIPIGEVPESHQFHQLSDGFRVLRVHFHAMLHFLNPLNSIESEGKTAAEKIRHLLYRELTSHTTPFKASLALAVGAFMGIFPIHGFQVVTLIFLATKFKLNRPIAYLGVNVSCPPLLPFTIIAAVKIGDLFLPGAISLDTIDHSLIEKGGMGFLAFVLGSIVLAPIIALIAFLISYPLFLGINRKK